MYLAKWEVDLLSAKVKNLFMFNYIIDIFEVKRSSKLVENFFYDLYLLLFIIYYLFMISKFTKYLGLELT